MYNMDISIFGYKIGLEILILIGIIYLILATHTLCGCCNFYSLIEGMDSGSTMGTMGTGTTNGSTIGSGQVKAKVQAKVQQAKNNMAQSSVSSDDTTPVTPTTTTEGFTGANINYVFIVNFIPI